MKIMTAFLLVCAACAFSNELGLIIGEPTGISYRAWLGTSNAMDFAVGWSVNTRENDHFDIHGAYLFGRKTDMRIDGYRIPWYFGPGGRIKLGEKDAVLGFRFPFGLYYKFRTVPFSMFFELAPGLNITPSTEFDITGGLGFRYIFGTAKSEPATEESVKRDRR